MDFSAFIAFLLCIGHLGWFQGESIFHRRQRYTPMRTHPYSSDFNHLTSLPGAASEFDASSSIFLIFKQQLLLLLQLHNPIPLQKSHHSLRLLPISLPLPNNHSEFLNRHITRQCCYRRVHIVKHIRSYHHHTTIGQQNYESQNEIEGGKNKLWVLNGGSLLICLSKAIELPW